MEGTAEIVKMITKASPIVWDATVRQQYFYGIIFIIISVVLGIISALGFWAGVDEKSDGTGLLVGAIFGIFAVGFLIFGVMYCANPEYWAIMDLKP